MFPEITLFTRKNKNSTNILSSLAQPHTSTSDCEVVGNIPGSLFVKAFSALPSHSQ